MDLSKLTLGDRIMGATGILLVITLLFLPWHDLDIPSIDVGGVEVGGGSVTRTAIESPNGFWGILALLLTIVIVALLIVTRLTTAKLPEMPMPLNRLFFFGAIAVLAFLLLKLLVETDALGFGCWLAVLLAAGMAAGGFLKMQEPETPRAY